MKSKAKIHEKCTEKCNVQSRQPNLQNTKVTRRKVLIHILHYIRSCYVHYNSQAMTEQQLLDLGYNEQ